MVGVKRKLSMSGASKLGSLHNAVYFDENDFDDDDQLDFEAPDPFCNAVPTMKGSTASINGSNRERNSSTAQSFTAADVHYPELPSLPNDEEPPSSNSMAFLPWSSSPSTHALPASAQKQQPPPPAPPVKRRTLPWQEQDKKDEQRRRAPAASSAVTYPKPEQRERSSVAATTPAQQKYSNTTDRGLPWNKTASAIKHEQREHRRESRKGPAAAAATGQMGPPSESEQQPKGDLPLFLSDEQRGVLDAVVNRGKSVFFTGSAGTGKSVLMRAIIKALHFKYRNEKDRVAVTASTGLAACNIEGMTLHSFAGIGLGKEDAPELVKKVNCISIPVAVGGNS